MLEETICGILMLSAIVGFAFAMFWMINKFMDNTDKGGGITMDVREKLVELLTGYSIDTKPDVEYVADHLIANGVTVQEWISVSECMPEDLAENKGKKVINCIVEHDPYGNGKTTAQFRQRKYDKYSDKWYWSKIGGCTVIRWTMMPQPPKGE